MLTLSLFSPAQRGLPRMSEHWYACRDGDVQAVALFTRHYSCLHPTIKWSGGNASKFAGPGAHLCLLLGTADALYVWRHEQVRRDGQVGINCTIFRNESSILSSVLIGEAMDLAWQRWPGTRLYTFVAPRQIRSTNPGYCFLHAGWQHAGWTKVHHHRILETWPVLAGQWRHAHQEQEG